LKGYKPEVTNPQHTKVEIFKGKVKNKKLNSEIGILFSNKLFLTVNKHKNHMSLKILSLLSFGMVSLHFNAQLQGVSTNTFGGTSFPAVLTYSSPASNLHFPT
jgi:hypothetical protein